MTARCVQRQVWFEADENMATAVFLKHMGIIFEVLAFWEILRMSHDKRKGKEKRTLKAHSTNFTQSILLLWNVRGNFICLLVSTKVSINQLM